MRLSNLRKPDAGGVWVVWSYYFYSRGRLSRCKCLTLNLTLNPFK